MPDSAGGVNVYPPWPCGLACYHWVSIRTGRKCRLKTHQEMIESIPQENPRRAGTRHVMDLGLWFSKSFRSSAISSP
jgi:hypothetical protein